MRPAFCCTDNGPLLWGLSPRWRLGKVEIAIREIYQEAVNIEYRTLGGGRSTTAFTEIVNQEILI
jgi:hypothetical protein